jgi:hypothetical protein
MGGIACQKDLLLITKGLGLALIDTVVGQPGLIQTLELGRCDRGASQFLKDFHSELLWLESGMLFGCQESIVEQEADLTVGQWEADHAPVVGSIDDTIWCDIMV